MLAFGVGRAVEQMSPDVQKKQGVGKLLTKEEEDNVLCTYH